MKRDIGGTIIDADTSTRIELPAGSPVWYAAYEWLERHDIDPRLIPVANPVVVFRAARRINYHRIRTTDGGRKIQRPDDDLGAWRTDLIADQGEGLWPYPPELSALLGDV